MVYPRKNFLVLKPVTIPNDERSPLNSYTDDELMEELMSRSSNPAPHSSEEIERILEDISAI